MKRILLTTTFLFIYLISNVANAQLAKENKAIKGAIQIEPSLVICDAGEYPGYPVSIESTNPKVQEYIRLMRENPESARSFQDNLKTAEIVLDFDAGFLGNSDARNAMEFAASIWELELISSVPIVVDLQFGPQGANTIASTGSNIVINVPNAPDASLRYNSALANSIAGIDLLPGQADMFMTFNEDFAFYYGTDRNPPSGLTDFVTVALHEMGHGLGFNGTLFTIGGECAIGGSNPSMYDVLVVTGNGVPILDFPFNTEAQRQIITSNNLFMSGFNAAKALEGKEQEPRIFAPGECRPGNSYSHWNDATFPIGDPNSLMRSAVSSGVANHNVGDLTRGLFKDLGWRMADPNAEFDIGVAEIESPSSGEGLSSTEQVSVRVGNLGSSTIESVIVSYKIDDGAYVTEEFVASLQPDQERVYTFNQTADLSGLGEYVITAKVDYFIDEFKENDINEKSVINGEVVEPELIDQFPYNESFEADDGGWTSSTLWALGEPNATIINSASDGANAWVTNLTGNHPDETTAFLTTPGFDFAGFNNPVAEFDIWYEIETGWDGFAFQVSDDNGVTWTTVGEFGDPNNWYNDGAANPNFPGNVNGVDALDAAISNPEGWTGEGVNGTGGWVRASHEVEVGGVTGVQFRFIFASDPAVNFEGAGVDNFTISATPSVDNDAAVVAITSPVSGNLTGAEQITATVRNLGVNAISNFDISYQIDAGVIIQETITDNLSAGQQLEYTFTQTGDFSVKKSYDLRVFTSLAGDENTANDELAVQVVNEITVAAFPYVESFEADAGSWFASGDNVSWERGIPSNATINTASDGNYAWVTSANGDYNLGEASFLESPFFDFSGLTEPVIAFDLWYETLELDVVTIQVTTDNGATWQTLDGSGQTFSWMEPVDGVINTLTGFTDGWIGSTGGYTIAYNEISGLAGEPLVKFRFAFRALSDFFGGTDTEEGIAIDRIRIFEKGAAEAITCTDPIVAPNDPGQNNAAVTVSNPTFAGGPPANVIYYNDFNLSADPSGTYPIGVTTVNFLVDVDGVISFCNSTVEVQDTENPTITCPDDVTIALESGQASVVVEYPLPSVSDNFGFPNQVTYSTAQAVLAGNSVGCPSGPQSFFRVFQLETDFDISDEFLTTSVDMGIQTSGDNASEGNVNIYALSTTDFDNAPDDVFQNMVLVGSAPYSLAANVTNSIINIPISVTIPANSVAVVEFTTELGNDDGFFAGSNSNQTGDSYILAGGCGIGVPDDVVNIDFPNSQWVMNLNGVSDAGGVPELVSGGGSGANFPVGINTESYRVVDATGNEATCSFDINVVTATLEAPVATDASAITGGSFTANWDAVSGVTFYELFVFEKLTNEPVPGFDGLIVDVTAVGVTGLSTSTVYAYTVRSLNSDTPTEYSVQSNEILTSTTIAVPTGLEVADVQSTTAFVNWDNVSGIEEYKLDLSDDNFASVLSTFTTTRSDFSLTGLEPSKVYQIRVRSANLGGESANSASVQFSTLPLETLALTATNVTNNSFDANWEVSPNSTGYRLDVSGDGFNSFVIEDQLVNATTFNVTGLLPNRGYSFRVRVESASGVSPNSNDIRLITAADAPVATAPAEVTSYGFVAQWNNPDNINTFILDISEDNFATFLEEGIAVIGDSYLFVGTEASTDYYYRVRAVNERGVQSEFSNTIQFTSGDNSGAVPPTPVAEAATDVRSSRFFANWSGSDALFYQLAVSDDGFVTNLPFYNDIKVFSTSLLVQNIQDDTDYEYRVRAFNNEGFSDLSNVISVRTVLGLEDLADLEGVSAFPNPTLSQFEIVIDNRIFGEYEIRLFDKTGRLISNDSFEKAGVRTSKTMDLNQMPAGVYFITVQTEKAAEVLRVIKK